MPLSDLTDLLQPLERPRFRDELVRDLERDGLVSCHTRGDDLVVELSPRGRATLLERPGTIAAPRLQEDDDDGASE